MGGGLMQLVAYGSQDVYLTGNPQITFWKVVYRRHTNFAIESVQQTFSGATGFGKSVVATVSRNGDLIHKCYLQVTLPSASGSGEWVAGCGHKLLKTMELEVGGQTIDKQYGEWLSAWADLTMPAEKKATFDKMIGQKQTVGQTLYIPLEFYFCTNPGLALPLIALQYHEIRLKFDFASAAECGGSAADEMGDCSLYVDYIYLDTDERRRMAQSSHEFLITQLQYNGGDTMDNGRCKARLNFNHPVKELVWLCKNGSGDAVKGGKTKLTLNGHDRFDERDAEYFNWVQPFQHHTRCPSGQVNVYSFALKPEESQPSGSCNFSRIDNAQLQITDADSTADTLAVYATNWNVFRVMSGMGGLAYSN